jgi:hypothetical protein
MRSAFGVGEYYGFFVDDQSLQRHTQILEYVPRSRKEHAIAFWPCHFANCRIAVDKFDRNGSLEQVEVARVDRFSNTFQGRQINFFVDSFALLTMILKNACLWAIWREAANKNRMHPSTNEAHNS